MLTTRDDLELLVSSVPIVVLMQTSQTSVPRCLFESSNASVLFIYKPLGGKTNVKNAVPPLYLLRHTTTQLLPVLVPHFPNMLLVGHTVRVFQSLRRWPFRQWWAVVGVVRAWSQLDPRYEHGMPRTASKVSFRPHFPVLQAGPCRAM